MREKIICQRVENVEVHIMSIFHSHNILGNQYGAWRRGKRPSVLAQGTMFESLSRLRQQTFSILMPRMKSPPGGPGCHYKDPNATG